MVTSYEFSYANTSKYLFILVYCNYVIKIILDGGGAARTTIFACQNVQTLGLKIECFTHFEGPPRPLSCIFSFNYFMLNKRWFWMVRISEQ